MYKEAAPTLLFPSVFGKCLQNREEIQPYTIGSKGVSLDSKSDEILYHFQTHLPLEGTLIAENSGYWYLDLHNRFISDALTFLKRHDLRLERPPYFAEEFAYGAHISVALPQEEKRFFALPETSRQIHFIPTGCYYTTPKNWKDCRRVWFLTVESPELGELRNELGLSKKLYGEEFYVTLAVEKRFLSLENILARAKQTVFQKPSSK